MNVLCELNEMLFYDYKKGQIKMRLIVSFKIQVEYPVLICYNKQWNEIPIF